MDSDRYPVLDEEQLWEQALARARSRLDEPDEAEVASAAAHARPEARQEGADTDSMVPDRSTAGHPDHENSDENDRREEEQAWQTALAAARARLAQNIYSQRPDVHPDAHPNAQPHSRPDARPTARPDARPIAQPAAQPDTRPMARPSAQTYPPAQTAPPAPAQVAVATPAPQPLPPVVTPTDLSPLPASGRRAQRPRLPSVAHVGIGARASRRRRVTGQMTLAPSPAGSSSSLERARTAPSGPPANRASTQHHAMMPRPQKRKRTPTDISVVLAESRAPRPATIVTQAAPPAPTREALSRVLALAKPRTRRTSPMPAMSTPRRLPTEA